MRLFGGSSVTQRMIPSSEIAAALLSDSAGLWLHKIAKRSLDKIIVAALIEYSTHPARE